LAGENEKKQVPLRLNKKLWESLSAWAEDDFRSLNGQIEFLLTECVKRRYVHTTGSAENSSASEE